MEVSSKSASPGGRAPVVISINLAKASSVLGLQWETTFSAKQMSIEGGGPTVSDAAKAAGKSLTCAGKAAKEPEFHSYTCILIGGQKEINSGPIAIFNFHISPKAQSGASPVRVGHAEAVTKDLQKISLRDAEGVVMVTR
jgi:hypothetical protein